MTEKQKIEQEETRKSFEIVLRSEVHDIANGIKYPEVAIQKILYEFDKAIAGRSAASAEIAELKEALRKAVEVIRLWHQADDVWEIYFNNAPEMKSIREQLLKQ